MAGWVPARHGVAPDTDMPRLLVLNAGLRCGGGATDGERINSPPSRRQSVWTHPLFFANNNARTRPFPGNQRN